MIIKKAIGLSGRIGYSFSHVVGSPHNNPITLSTSEWFQRMVERNPSAPLLNSYDQGVSFTYEQMHHKIGCLADGLVSRLNLKPKDRIGIYSYNKWEWFATQMAAARCGLILVNINPAYQSEELAYTIEKVGLKVLVLSDQHRHLDYISIVRKILPEMESNQRDWQSKRFPLLKAVVRMSTDDHHLPGFFNFTDIFGEYSSKRLPGKFDCLDAVNIQFTSGTTGRPKAATLSHFNILNNAHLIGVQCNYSMADNITVPVPFYHCFGMIMGGLAAMVRGASFTIVGEGFNPKKSLEAVCKYKSTSLYGVPTMFIEYIREAGLHPYDLTSLRTGIVAGSLCSEALMQKIFKILNIRDITNCYGMTETSPVSFQTSPKDTLLQKTTTVGRILPGLEGRIVSSEGKLCQYGEAGELEVKGWSVMLAYWEDPAATEKSIVEGWMKTGDLGVIDESGYLSIVGRIKDMIIRGGENIYPKQIEQFLGRLEEVMDVQVVGVSDDKFGEETAAVIKVKCLASNTLKKEDILGYCQHKIAYYKIPKYVKFVEQLPLTVTGKPQKYVLREQLEAEKKSGKIEEYLIK